MFRAKSPLIIGSVLVLWLLGGCSAHKTDRGYLIRHESAWEVNRTPWIGCPPDSNCDGEQSGFFDCLKKDNGDGRSGKKFRRHCGVTPDCSAKNPCCKTLGCGMWVDPGEPMVAGSPARACGLTPFCSPMKPCGLTPYCGKPGGGMGGGMGMMSPNTLMLGNSAMVSGGFIPNTVVMPTPTPTIPQPTLAPSGSTSPSKVPTVAGPNGMRIGTTPNRFPNGPIPGSAGGTLISMGVVPGVSTITTGGLVAAAGVATPAGMMTPNGVQLPNGVLQSQGVIRACALHPNCTAARPCCQTTGCGMIVPIAMVSNNAVQLASALSAPGIAGNVLPAYGAVPGYVNGNMMSAGGIPTDRTGTGMLVNPITGQPVAGLSMNGTTQLGYPPIGYAPTGYSPGYPRYAPATAAEEKEEKEEEEPNAVAPTPQSQMPAPRFHPVPSKPAFQRSEGLPTVPSSKRTLSGTGKVLTKETLNAAMEQAYLEGIADAIEDVQEEIDAQNQELAKAEIQAKILRQAKQLQTQLDTRQEATQKLQELNLHEERTRQQEIQQARYRQSQLQQAYLQQVALQQNSLTPPTIQQAQFQQPQFQQLGGTASTGQGAAKGFFSSAVGSFSGHSSLPTATPPIPQQRTDANPTVSAKASGANFMAKVSDTVSPLTEFFGVGRPKIPHPQTVGMPNASRPQPVPVAQTVPASSVRSKPQKNVNAPSPLCLPCPPLDVVPTGPVAQMPDLEPQVAPDHIPPRPTTAARKPKTIIDTDDDSEPNMVQSANFVVHGS